MKKISKLSLLALIPLGMLLFSSGDYLYARKVTTKLNAPTNSLKKKAEKHKSSTTDKSAREKIAGKLNFMGYDKKTSAAKETFFVDNGSDISLSGLDLEISYFNSAGKLIHKRKVEINEYFPAKETRKVDIPSWDSQKSFHYVNSVPGGKGSISYTVKFKVISFTEYKK